MFISGAACLALLLPGVSGQAPSARGTYPSKRSLSTMRTKDELSFPTGKARPHRLRAGERKVGSERRVKVRPYKSHFRKITRAFFLILLPALVAATLSLLPSRLCGGSVAREANTASGTIEQTGTAPPSAVTSADPDPVC